MDHEIRESMNSLNIGDAVAALHSTGGYSCPFLPEDLRSDLLDETEMLDLAWEPQRPGSGKVRQQMCAFDSARARNLPNQHTLLQFRDLFQEHFLRALGIELAEELFPDIPLQCNSVRVHQYLEGSIGITPHVDGKSYRNLICIFVLEGNLRFQLCANRSGHRPTMLASDAGHLIMLRAPGFRGAKKQPFHRVLKSAESRTTLGLRQYVQQ